VPYYPSTDLEKSAISDVEIVGGSIRVNSIKRTLGAALGLDASAVNFGLKTTMNSDEAVARGAALQCAMESSRIKVKPFSIIDKVYYPIEVQYEADASAVSAGVEGKDDGSMEVVDDLAHSSSAGGINTIQIYARGDDLPRKPRRLTFRNKVDSFVVRTAYTAEADLPNLSDRVIGTYTIKIPDNYKGVPHDVRVTFVMDKHGCVVLHGAQLMEEYIVEVAEEKDAKDSDDKKEGEDAGPKKKTRKIDLSFDVSQFGLSRQQIKDSVEIEAHMANSDRLIIETSDRRNELESYVYGMRSKLDGPLKDFSTNSEKSQFNSLIDQTESWLYEDGFDRYIYRSHYIFVS
jgi:heat shock 70kDa protein 4